MTVDVATFRIAMPGFEDVACWPDQRVDYWLTQACAECNETQWGSKYEQGVFNLLAHKLLIQGQQQIEASSMLGATGKGREISANKHNQVNVNRQDYNSQGLEATSYGREFDRLRKSIHPNWAISPC